MQVADTISESYARTAAPTPPARIQQHNNDTARPREMAPATTSVSSTADQVSAATNLHLIALVGGTYEVVLVRPCDVSLPHRGPLHAFRLVLRPSITAQVMPPNGAGVAASWQDAAGQVPVGIIVLQPLLQQHPPENHKCVSPAHLGDHARVSRERRWALFWESLRDVEAQMTSNPLIKQWDLARRVRCLVAQDILGLSILLG